MIFSAFAQGRAMRARRFPTSRPYCANLGAPREYSPKRAKAGDPMTEYYIPTQAGEAELVEKRSRFIGHVWRVESEEEARARIEEMKKRYYDARHNCWCYLLREGPVRYSDDGEPQGTGGVPVLEVLQREGLTDLVCVVTRYFGGVLLGAGGLVRAYSHGAKLAVDAAERMTMSECTELALEFGYDLYGKISYLLPQFHAQTTFSDFGAVVRLQVLVKDCFVPSFEKALAEGTSALVTPRAVDRRYACIPE